MGITVQAKGEKIAMSGMEIKAAREKKTPMDGAARKGTDADAREDEHLHPRRRGVFNRQANRRRTH